MTTRQWIAGEIQFHGRIDGGWRTTPICQLCMLWTSNLTRAEMNTFFAIMEMTVTREAADICQPRYRAAELARLTGRSEGECRAATVRLIQAGLVDDRDLSLRRSPDDITDFNGFIVMMGRIRNRRRNIHIPRRLVRAMCRMKKSQIAVTLAMLIRLFYRHKDHYRVDGRVSNSWIMDVFGMAEKSVIEARKSLDFVHKAEDDAPFYVRNHFGTRYFLQGYLLGIEEIFTAPYKQKSSLRELQKQQSSKHTSPHTEQRQRLIEQAQLPEHVNRDTWTPASKRADAAAESKRKPGEWRYRTIQSHHLHDTRSLREIHADLSPDMDLFHFAVYVVRARRKGRNPGGMLKHLLEQQPWGWMHDFEEDLAREIRIQWYSSQERERTYDDGGSTDADVGSLVSGLIADIQPPADHRGGSTVRGGCGGDAAAEAAVREGDLRVHDSAVLRQEVRSDGAGSGKRCSFQSR